MDLTEYKWLLEMAVVPLFIVLCVLTTKEVLSKRHSLTSRSYVYYALLAVYLVIVWNIVPTDFSYMVADWFSF